MKTVICLIPFSDGVLSMYKGEIASIDETKATALIASGYVAEYSAAGGGGVLVVTETETVDGDITTYTLNHTFKEISDAGFAVLRMGNVVMPLRAIIDAAKAVVFLQIITKPNFVGADITYEADSDNGYPSRSVVNGGAEQ